MEVNQSVVSSIMHLIQGSSSIWYLTGTSRWFTLEELTRVRMSFSLFMMTRVRYSQEVMNGKGIMMMRGVTTHWQREGRTRLSVADMAHSRQDRATFWTWIAIHQLMDKFSFSIEQEKSMKTMHKVEAEGEARSLPGNSRCRHCLCCYGCCYCSRCRVRDSE